MSRISPFVQGNEHPPVLLVDGYNVLHMYVQHMQETQPKSRMATSQVLEELRTGLDSEMVAYSQARHIKVVVVYDAMNRPPHPIYVDIRTSTRLAHSAFNLLSLMCNTQMSYHAVCVLHFCKDTKSHIKDAGTLTSVVASRTPLEIQHFLHL